MNDQEDGGHKFRCDCGAEYVVLGQYPDTGTSVDIYTVQCPNCGAKGTLSIENQDGTYEFSPDDPQDSDEDDEVE